MTRASAIVVLLGALAAVLAGLASSAAADAKTAVTVKFVLKAYDGEFRLAEVQAIEQRAAARLAKRLAEQVPFLDFTTAPDPRFKLTVTLRPRAAAERAGAPGEVVFDVKLEGPDVRLPPQYVVFRPANDISAVPLVDGFVEEIDLRLTEDVYSGQLRPMLLKVPIAARGELVRSPSPGWILPYRREELCLHTESELGIQHHMALAGAVRRLRLIARADGDAADGRLLGTPVNPSEFQQLTGTVTVEFVWVTAYQGLVPCTDAFSR